MSLEKLVRPKRTEGTTYQEEVGCGHLFVTVSKGDNGYLEVFATLGKAGGCSNCQNEALTTAITLGLRYGIPMEEYVKRTEGIQCPNPRMFPAEDRCLSCPDAIGKAMRKFLENQGSIQPTLQQAQAPLLDITKTRKGRIESAGLVERLREMPKSQDGHCPDCGSVLMFVEGCATCSNPSCGWSKC